MCKKFQQYACNSFTKWRGLVQNYGISSAYALEIP